MPKPIIVEEAQFKSAVIDSALPVMVEFSAPWCGPCKMLDPLLEQLAAEWNGRVGYVKVNVDNSAQLVAHYQVMSVPTVFLFKGGQPLERLSGYQPKDKITAKFQPHI
ncbi:MAG TPA: thioredoxin [Anaerolineaceae bacterium]|nr:thioredoxin [Anaerolineaceae bacterium]